MGGVMTVQPLSSWHLDKRVPIALIAALIIQSLTAIWWAATVDSTVATNTAANIRQDVRIEGVRSVIGQQAVQLGRIETNTEGLRVDVSRLIDATERSRQP